MSHTTGARRYEPPGFALGQPVKGVTTMTSSSWHVITGRRSSATTRHALGQSR
jgi:hypothetical protein